MCITNVRQLNFIMTANKIVYLFMSEKLTFSETVLLRCEVENHR